MDRFLVKDHLSTQVYDLVNLGNIGNALGGRDAQLALADEHGVPHQRLSRPMRSDALAGLHLAAAIWNRLPRPDADAPLTTTLANADVAAEHCFRTVALALPLLGTDIVRRVLAAMPPRPHKGHPVHGEGWHPVDLDTTRFFALDGRYDLRVGNRVLVPLATSALALEFADGTVSHDLKRVFVPKSTNEVAQPVDALLQCGTVCIALNYNIAWNATAGMGRAPFC